MGVRFPRLTKALLTTCTAGLLSAAGAGGWAGYLRLTGNIHEVEPGSVFRTAQLSPAALTSFVRNKGIKTVINLRGRNPGKAWYDEEVAATDAAGAHLINIPLSANREPRPAVLRRLVEVLRNSEKPIVIHCEGGADRTGLASALYELIVMHRPAEAAGSQLSFRYGHFPWLTSRTGAMDRTYWRVAAQGVPSGDVGASESSR